MKRTRLLLVLVLLGSSAVGSLSAQVYPVRLDATEPRNSVPPPSLILADGGIEFPDGSIQRVAARANPDPPCFDDQHRFVDCGNGTVTDTETGLVWLEDLNCNYLSTGTYAAVNTYVGNFWEGSCPGLTDGSRPGDWRLATSEEWEQLKAGMTCPTGPKIAGAAGGCYIDSPWAIGLVGTEVFWASNTTFSNVTKAWGADMAATAITGELFKDGTTGYWPVRGDGRPAF